jgi:hypothetical protein
MESRMNQSSKDRCHEDDDEDEDILLLRAPEPELGLVAPLGLVL